MLEAPRGKGGEMKLTYSQRNALRELLGRGGNDEWVSRLRLLWSRTGTFRALERRSLVRERAIGGPWCYESEYRLTPAGERELEAAND